MIHLAGYDLECLPSYSDPFRNILVVIEFTVRLNELEPEMEAAYSCFFPNIIRYTACDPSVPDPYNTTCLQSSFPGDRPAR